MKKRLGVTMVEILIVIVIIAGLGVIGILNGNRQVVRGHIDQTATNLEIFAANLEDAINDVGEADLESAASEDEKRTTIQLYLDEISSRYLGFSFDYSTLELTSYGFAVSTKDYKDAWGNECRLFATTGSAHNRYTLASAGPDAFWSDATYDAAIIIVQ